MKSFYLYIAICVLLAGCKREQAIELAPPSVVINDYNGSPVLQEPGGTVTFHVTFQSVAGIRQITMEADGAPVETVDLDGAFTYERDFDFQVPASQLTGTTIEIIIKLSDDDSRSSYSQPYIISVNQPYTIDEVTIEGTAYTQVKGKLNRDYLFTSDKRWLIDSIVSVDEGATLTIEPGTTVYFKTFADHNKASVLAVARGSKIIAEGTRTEPIVFTSRKTITGNAAIADWGGLIICGNAPINRGSTAIEDGFRYGGSVPADNSGRLRFVRIEYAGKGDYHGLHLFGVGSGTRLEYLEIFQTYNNAIRIRGGRVSLKYVAGIEHGGYGLWADEGWQGNGQFWLFQTRIPATLVPVNYWNQARSVEFRNDATLPEKQPRTTFRVSNVTLIGNGSTGNTEDGTRRGVRIRTGAVGFMHNAIITGFPDEAMRVEDLPLSDLGNNTIISHMHVFNNRINWGQEAETFFFESGDYHLSETPVPGIALTAFDAVADGGLATSGLGSWFTPVNYIGAVNPADDWTSGGHWFKDRNGNFR